MELTEEYNAKLGQRALELKMEEGGGEVQTDARASSAISPYNPSGPTLGGPH